MSQDREFETYINGTSELSERYGALPPVEPPDYLDAAILAEARRAVGARPGGVRKRWFMPLSMAASLFVAVMLGLQLPHLLKEPGVAQPALQDRVAATAAEEVAAAPAPAPAPLAEANGRNAPEPAKKRVAKPAVAAPAPAPAEPKAEAQAPGPVPEAKAAAAPRLFEAAPVMPAPARVAAERQRAAFEAESEARAKQASPAYRPQSDTGVVPALPPQAAAPVAAPAAPLAQANRAAEAPEPARMVGQMVAAQPAPRVQQSIRERDVAGSPQDWLARIRQLRQQGKLDEAGKELAAFRKRYPEYPVPKELER